ESDRMRKREIGGETDMLIKGEPNEVTLRNIREPSPSTRTVAFLNLQWEPRNHGSWGIRRERRLKSTPGMSLEYGGNPEIGDLSCLSESGQNADESIGMPGKETSYAEAVATSCVM
ncbi:putative 2-oxoglutarate dehydrogenase E1 component DHKTD1 like mitochondrial, partial [Dissostichus eleginoides]